MVVWQIVLCFFFREPTLKSKQRVRHWSYKFYLERNLNLTDYNENVTNGKEKSTCSKLYTGVQICRHLANCLMKSNRLCSHSPLCKMLDFYAGCFPFQIITAHLLPTCHLVPLCGLQEMICFLRNDYSHRWFCPISLQTQLHLTQENKRKQRQWHSFIRTTWNRLQSHTTVSVWLVTLASSLVPSQKVQLQILELEANWKQKTNWLYCPFMLHICLVLSGIARISITASATASTSMEINELDYTNSTRLNSTTAS